MIKDSGQRTEFENGFVRDMHEGKGRMDLMPWRAIMELSKHCEEGALKYGERNIDLGAPQHSLIDSAFRHLAKYTIGETDENHLRAAMWNIAWALEQEVCRPDLQDIPARMKKDIRKIIKSIEDGTAVMVKHDLIEPVDDDFEYHGIFKSKEEMLDACCHPEVYKKLP